MFYNQPTPPRHQDCYHRNLNEVNPQGFYSNQPTPRRQDYHHNDVRFDMPSSDPPEDNGVNDSYSGITDFLQQLDSDQKNTQRGLSRYFNVFEDKNFYSIYELTKISAETLSSEFGFSSGNAQFFLEAISNEIKRVDRAKKSKYRR